VAGFRSCLTLAQFALPQAKCEEDARRAYVTRAAAPMPASQAFKATTRGQVCSVQRMDLWFA